MHTDIHIYVDICMYVYTHIIYIHINNTTMSIYNITMGISGFGRQKQKRPHNCQII